MATESMRFESAQNNFIFPNHSSTFERLKGMSYVYTELEEKKLIGEHRATTYKISS